MAVLTANAARPATLLGTTSYGVFADYDTIILEVRLVPLEGTFVHHKVILRLTDRYSECKMCLGRAHNAN
jgi:hypothetical protein